MSRNTFAIKFYCRESKADKQGYSPIELSININQKRVFLNLQRKERPSDFNRKRKSQDLEDYLSLMHTTINGIMTEMLRNGEPVTATALREYVRTGGYKSYTIADLFNDYIKLQSSKSITKETVRKYEIVRDLFAQDNDLNRECTYITNAVVKTFFNKLDNMYELSTSAGMKTKFKAVVQFGLDNARLKISPFSGIKISKGKKDITYLTTAEIQALKDLRIENESLSKVRDVALFQIASGLAYCDLCNLTPEDLKEKNGQYYINKKRQKTGSEYFAVILPMGVEIWNKYNGKLPIISNQKYNVYLKTIQHLTDIKTNLHSHMLRHTYACLSLNSGVRLETVSKMLGHSNTQITQHFYAKLTDETILKESLVFYK